MTMYDDRYFTTDTVAAEFQGGSGIDVDDDGDVSITWDEVEKVHVEDAAVTDHFNEKTFYRLPATVARPIEQTYGFHGQDVTLKKPREELKRSAWTLDRSPWTIGHPATRMVKSLSDARGFWDDTQYDERADGLDSHLHIPIGDKECQGAIERTSEVSVGFHNEIQRPDGGETDDGVDGYQTNIVFDHCASVDEGRCSAEEGCGIGMDERHGHVVSITETDTNTLMGTDTTDAEHAVHEPDFSGTTTKEWNRPLMEDFDTDDLSEIDDHFLVSETGFPPENFGELSLPVVEPNGDLNLNALANAKARSGQVNGLSSEDESRVDSIIDRLAEDNFEDADFSEDSGTTDCSCEDGCDCTSTTKTDETENHDLAMDFELDMSDLTADAVLTKLADEHDDIAEKVEALEAAEDAAERLEQVREALDYEGDDLGEAVQYVADRAEELAERVDELEQPQKEEYAESIVEATDRFGDRESLMDEDLETLEERHELIEELGGETKTKNAPTTDSTEDDGGSSQNSYGPRRKVPAAWA